MLWSRPKAWGKKMQRGDLWGGCGGQRFPGEMVSELRCERWERITRGKRPGLSTGVHSGYRELTPPQHEGQGHLKLLDVCSGWSTGASRRVRGSRKESRRQPQLPNVGTGVPSASRKEPRDDFKEWKGITICWFQRDTPSGSWDGWELGVRLREL